MSLIRTARRCEQVGGRFSPLSLGHEVRAFSAALNAERAKNEARAFQTDPTLGTGCGTSRRTRAKFTARASLYRRLWESPSLSKTTK